MNNWKSLTAGGETDPREVATRLNELWARYPRKLYFFLKHGYHPHIWQTLFHTAQYDEKLVRYRHLAAGRRGGKTLSAAWEVLYYCMYPAEYHWDFHARSSSRPLWVWALAKDHKVGRPSLLTFIDVMTQAGLVKDVDYRYNRAEKIIEFTESGTLLEFKSADDPQSLRGAGLDILWIDEAAFIPDDEAWTVVRPALSDKPGALLTTTTPLGTNWFYEEFWGRDGAMADARQARVEYVSLDNPHFPRDEWEYAKENMHPVAFKREYMASFHAMAGVELHGDWLKYYVLGTGTPFEHPDDIRLLPEDGKLKLKKYIGVDPAISLSEKADHFAMALIGIEPDDSRVYLLDTFIDRLDFPDQVSKIAEWHTKYRPDIIGIESNAYQRVLAQQVARLPSFPPVSHVMSKGKKHERILGMSPFFKVGRIRIHRRHSDFIDQWISYDSQLKNPKDDLLDAVEIALGVAGVILPNTEYVVKRAAEDEIHEMALAQLAAQKAGNTPYDDHLGSEF
jgi:predicted phage terminase large subunit-like protein